MPPVQVVIQREQLRDLILTIGHHLSSQVPGRKWGVTLARTSGLSSFGQEFGLAFSLVRLAHLNRLYVIGPNRQLSQSVPQYKPLFGDVYQPLQDKFIGVRGHFRVPVKRLVVDYHHEQGQGQKARHHCY